MKRRTLLSGILATMALAAQSAPSPLTPEPLPELPPPADQRINFAHQIKPLLEDRCVQCHGHEKDKGGFRLDTRELLLKGGDTGAAVVPGNSAKSHLIALVAGVDPDNVMPIKGTKLTSEEVGLLRAWIDQDLPWAEGIHFGKVEVPNLKRVGVEIPPDVPFGEQATDHPVDRFVADYFVRRDMEPAPLVDDRTFARRVYLDVIGLLPPPDELNAFLTDDSPDKREALVNQLLTRDQAYAEHWMTFWNDLLRNDYRGTGFIDGGREQISYWLFQSLAENKPFDQFVRELVDPVPEATGFTKGIVWRGAVNASQRPPMQASQNIAQIFLGVNLKCASCHDSFINEYTLKDAYGLASIYVDGPMEVFHCDKPTGKNAEVKFLYPQLGSIDGDAPKGDRTEQLARILTRPENGRLPRTLVNRFWARLLGRGLVEPLDDMDQRAWHPDLLDWLAEDFVSSGYDVKHLLRRILTSRTYQLPSVDTAEGKGSGFVFQGPAVRRMNAEQFRDALSRLTDQWHGWPGSALDFTAGHSRPGEVTQARDALLPRVPARWIWNAPDAGQDPEIDTVWFRRTFHLADAPDRAAMVIAADYRYTLYLNGQRITAGENPAVPDVALLQGRLKKGRNVIAVEAVNQPRKPRLEPDAVVPISEPAGLVAYLWARRGEGEAERILDLATDSQWKFTNKKAKNWEKPDFKDDHWESAIDLGDADRAPWRFLRKIAAGISTATRRGTIRAALVASDPLMRALGRPNREQVTTRRATEATTLQALELTNGDTLAEFLKKGAEKLVPEPEANPLPIVRNLMREGLGRPPTKAEMKFVRQAAKELSPRETVEDFLWSMVMLPEFQLIH